MFQIEEAGQAQAGLIADLSRQTFYDTFAEFNTPEDMDMFMTEQFSREKLVAEVGAPGHIFFLATAGQEPVGYAFMREGERLPALEGKNPIEVARIYATGTYIGKGTGSALIQRCIEKAGDLGRDFIWLGVWEKNERAIRFYEKWGFRPFGTHDFLLGKDRQTDWLMGRNVRLPA